MFEVGLDEIRPVRTSGVSDASCYAAESEGVVVVDYH